MLLRSGPSVLHTCAAGDQSLQPLRSFTRQSLTERDPSRARSLPSAGPVVSWALGDGAARTAAAGRMLTRRDVSFTAVMLASAWYG